MTFLFVELDYKYIFCVGVAGKFPPNYIGGMMSGQALGGIFPSLVNILVIAIQVNIAFLNGFNLLLYMRYKQI